MSLQEDIAFAIEKMPVGYLVVWHNNRRIGSVVLSAESRKYFVNLFSMSLIQRDATKTEHYEVLSVRKVKQ